MIRVKDLVVHRTQTFSLRIPLLELPGKHILCIAGTNGSGKTTLMECLAGLLTPVAYTSCYE